MESGIAGIDLNESFVEDTIQLEHVDDNSINPIEEASQSNDNRELEEPDVGMSFVSGEEFAKFCHEYGFRKGFEWFSRSTTLMPQYKEEGVSRKGVRDKEPKYHMMERTRLCCKYGGRRCSPMSTVTGCKVTVEARIKDDKMVIRECRLDHNHDLAPDYSRIMINYRGIDDGTFDRMVKHDATGISITKNYNLLLLEVGGHENLTFNQRDLRNAINLHRRRAIFEGDAVAVEAHFKKMSQQNCKFYSAIQTDHEGRLLNMFWADGRSRGQYKDFGDIVTFDTTFLCNRYRLPFAPFIGCNHLGKSIVLGAALISSEDAESFVWVFKQWLQCMGGPPKGILTVQCKPIGRVVETVFPDAPHRLCVWHIMQNASRNLGKLAKWKEIQEDFNSVVHDSLSIEEFEEAWHAMVKI